MSNTLVAGAINPEAKFVDEDVTPELHKAGLAYLATYVGGFTYLVDLKRRNPANLSVGQVRGILNCIRAEVLRAQDVGEGAGEPLMVNDGRYAVLMTDKLRFFRVNTPTEGRWAKFTFVNEVFGGGNKIAIRNRQVRESVLTAIANDPDALARYGQELGECGVCGRELTDEQSRAIGIGPVCREKLGM
jgi:hypothetical protein